MHSITDLWQKQIYALFATTIPSSLCCHEKKGKKKGEKNVTFQNTQLCNFQNHLQNISANNGTTGWNDDSLVAVRHVLYPVSRCLMFPLLYSLSSGALEAHLQHRRGLPPFPFLCLPHLLWTLFFTVDLQWLCLCFDLLNRK